MKRPFAYIGFSSAVTLLVLDVLEINYALFVGRAALLMFVFSLAVPKYRKGTVFPLCFGSAVFSCLIYIVVYYAAVSPEKLLEGTEAMTTFYITDLPKKTSSGYYSYTAKTTGIDIPGAVQNIKIELTSKRPLYVKSYQLITAKLKFRSVGDSAFSSYSRWGKGIYLRAYINDYSVTQTLVNRLARALVDLRQEIVSTLTQNVKGDAGAFAAALITGYKDEMSTESLTAFRDAGTTHLMAVSGLHLTVITGAVRYLFKLFRVKDKVSSIFIIVFILLFSALAGFSKSIIRAGIMSIVYFAGDIINMKSDPLNSLGVAVFIICLNPFAPSDASAVLSVLAVLAILTATKEITDRREKWLEKYRRKHEFLKGMLRYITDGLAVSFCVVLFTLPATYIFFGTFSVIGIFINLFIIPLGSVSTVLSILTFIANKIHFLSAAFNFVDSRLNGLILSLVKTSASFDFATIEMDKVFGLGLTLILLVCAGCFFTGNKKAVRTAFCFSAISVAAMSIAAIII